MVFGQSCRKDAAVLTVQFYLPLFLHLSKYLGSVSDNGGKKGIKKNIPYCRLL